MIASARSMYILNCLNERGVIDYKSIAAELSISEATVRRDFEKLEQQGRLKRVQGGAMQLNGPDGAGEAELTMRSKRALHNAEKLAVARAAAERVKDGECVFLDVGTSIAPLADFLSAKRVQLVTYSNLVLQRLADRKCDLFVAGGKYDYIDGMFVGPVAENMLRMFHFDHAFIGCLGADIRLDTVFTTEMECMRMKQTAIQCAASSYLLLDASKLSKRAAVRVAGLSEFDTVFCNRPAEPMRLPPNFVLVD